MPSWDLLFDFAKEDHNTESLCKEISSNLLFD